MNRKSLGFFYRRKNKNVLDELEMYTFVEIRKSIKQVKNDIQNDKEEKYISKTSKPEIWEVVLIRREQDE